MPTPSLQLSPATIILETSSKQTLCWSACIGLRGFIGWALEAAEPELRNVLLPLFHSNHDAPAPFRILYEDASHPSEIHRFKLISFGPQGSLIHDWLSELLLGRVGSLRHRQQEVPFKLIDYKRETNFSVNFPVGSPASGESGEGATPSMDNSVFRLSTASPVFFKQGTDHFAKGTWTQLLALRFADLSGILRKSLEPLALPIPIEGDFGLRPIRLSFGGKSRTRHAGRFCSEAFIRTEEEFKWLKLLVQLGIGAHTAYGAGNFKIEIAENR